MRTRSAKAELGGGKIQLLLALLITAALFISGWRIIPIYIKSYDFQDTIRQKAKFARVERKTPEAVRDEIYKKAQELELPVERSQIRVSQTSIGLRISVNYRVPVDLIVYSLEIPFEYVADTGTTI
ncbi:MAG: DUF4845 domain-containing protein [Acidobacteria bacterium]|nr:DUF4845 domain-containing protein [Acidobacteriota bacterium]